MVPTFVCAVLHCGSKFQLNICRYVYYLRDNISTSSLVSCTNHKQCTGWSKSLFAPDDYITKTSKNILNRLIIMITYLELGIKGGVSVSLVSPWPWLSACQ
jgi:hypothetical protein